MKFCNHVKLVSEPKKIPRCVLGINFRFKTMSRPDCVFVRIIRLHQSKINFHNTIKFLHSNTSYIIMDPYRCCNPTKEYSIRNRYIEIIFLKAIVKVFLDLGKFNCLQIWILNWKCIFHFDSLCNHFSFSSLFLDH